LIQVIRKSAFDPGSSEFDPIRAVEYAANPLQYETGSSRRSIPGMGTIQLKWL